VERGKFNDLAQQQEPGGLRMTWIQRHLGFQKIRRRKCEHGSPKKAPFVTVQEPFTSIQTPSDVFVEPAQSRIVT